MIHITSEQRGIITLVSISGQLDATTASELEAALMGAYDAGSRQFLLDCPSLTYVSSAGLRILLKVYKHLKPMNGILALSSLQPHITNIFQLTGFQSIFPIHDTQTSGLQALYAAPPAAP